MAEAGIRIRPGSSGAQTSTLDLHALPKPIVAIIRATYGDATAHIFLISAVIAVVGVLAAVALPRITLRSSVDLAQPAASAPPAEEAAPEPSGYHGAHEAGAGEPDPVAVSAPTGGAVVTGRVEGPDRRSVAGAVLTVTDYPGHQVTREVSRSDGSYRLVLPSGGTYLLICAAENHQPMACMLTVGVGESRQDIALAGASAVEGRVLRGDGAPVGGATVTLTDARGEVVGAAVTGPDGAYLLADLYPGEYTLTATAENALPVARSVTVDQVGSNRVDVVLRSNATIAGTVRAARSGRPLADAAVTLLDGYGNVAGTTLTGEDGRYEFAGLLPGPYTLTASGYAPVAARVDLAGERTDRDIALGEPARASLSEG
jgi:hypothetical protein